MKRIIQLFICLFLLGGCQSSSSSIPEEITYDRVEGIVEIDYDSLVEKLDSPVDFILYIGRPDCGDCKLFQPYLESYIEEHEGSGIYYLNIKTFRDAAQSEDATLEQKEFYDNLKDNLSFVWTPTLARYQNGEVVDSFEFLDADYGRMDDDSKEDALQEFVREFENWMNRNLKVDENTDQ